ncbi:flagellar export chaperone FliS [Thermodesulfovibrio hydrogeniphilus]
MQVNDAYLQSKVFGADGLELIIMLYDKAIVSLQIAKEAIEAGVNNPDNLKRKVEGLTKATDIIYYLNDILDRQRGGEIAKNLGTIYSILADELVRANLFNDLDIISKSITILQNLKTAWQDVRKQLQAEISQERKTVAASI